MKNPSPSSFSIRLNADVVLQFTVEKIERHPAAATPAIHSAPSPAELNHAMKLAYNPHILAE